MDYQVGTTTFSRDIAMYLALPIVSSMEGYAGFVTILAKHAVKQGKQIVTPARVTTIVHTMSEQLLALVILDI